MSIAVSLNLPDGVILGVDSAVTLPGPNGNVLKVFEQAEKIFQFGERPIGIAAVGIASLGPRSIGSYLRECSVTFGTLKKVAEIAEQLRAFFFQQYMSEILQIEPEKQDDADLPEDLPTLQLIIGGFDEASYYSEVWEVLIPVHRKVGSANCLRAPGQFGANWFALGDPITRYFKGFDPGLPEQILQSVAQIVNRALNQNEIDLLLGAINKNEYPIPTPAMPIEVGMAFVRFLVELVVNHHRFSYGAPVVGGPITIGSVTYAGTQFTLSKDAK